MGEKLTIWGMAFQNFRSFGSEWQFVPLGGRGPAAVTGKNGGGKSTAGPVGLTWAYFDKGPPETDGGGRRHLSGGGLVCDWAPDDAVARVAVFHQTADPSELLAVVRSQPRKGNSSVQVRRGPVPELPLAVDWDPGAWGELVGEGDREVALVVGCDFDTFVRTVVHGQGDNWSLALSSDQARRDFVSALVHEEDLDEAYARARSRLAEVSKELGGVDARLGSDRQALEALGVDSLRTLADTWDAELCGRLAQAKADMEVARGALMRAQMADAEAAAAAVRRAEVQAQRPETPRAGEFEDAERSWAGYHSRVSGFVVAKRERLRELEGVPVGSACPTCGETVQAGGVLAHRQVHARREVQEAEAALAAAQAGHQQATEALEAFRAYRDKALATWQAELDALPGGAAPSAPGAARVLEAQEARVAELQRGENPHRALLADAMGRRVGLARRVAQGAAWAEHLRGEERVLALWEKILSPKGTVRDARLGGVLDRLEDAAAPVLEGMTGGRMRLRIDRRGKTGAVKTTVVVTVVLPSGAERDRELASLSGGERRRVCWALDRAVDQVFGTAGQCKISALFLDELIFSGLDEPGKAALVAGIASLGFADVLVVDHDPRMSAGGAFRRVIELTQGPDGLSCISVEER